VRKIALEEHFVTPELAKYGASTSTVAQPHLWAEASRRLLDFTAERLPEMDRFGLDVQVLSLNSPGIQAEPEAAVAVRAALAVNDLLASVIGDHPDRFRGFAALPMQDPSAAADELGRFLTSTRHDRLHPLWVTAATTALRRGELAGLKWADLDLDGRAAALSVRRSRTQVRYEVHEDAPKNAKARVVALDAATVEVLKAWHQRQREERMAFGPGRVDSGYVFTREDGTPLHPAAITNGFDRAVRRSGLPQLHLHGLRHSWATISLAAGTNVKVVQERLGHHSPAFTLSVYAHVLPGMQAEAAEAFAGLVLGGQQSARPVTL